MTLLPRRSGRLGLALLLLLLPAWAVAPLPGQEARERMPAEAASGNCSDCHLCPVPTTRVPCLKACPRTMMVHQTGQHSLEEATSTLLLDDLAELYEPVRFDHRGHARMALMGHDCATCHHYSPPGTIPPCKECHAMGAESGDLRKPNLKGAYHRQCMACHVEWSHETQCGACHAARSGARAAAPSADPTDIVGTSHPPLAAPTRRVYRTPYAQAPIVTFQHQEHVDLFGFRCVDCHHKESCVNCHDWRKAPDAPARSQAEVHAVCNGCHEHDPCAKCHSTRERPGFSHNRTGWPLNPYHQKLACWGCHPRGKDFGRVSRMCTGCHEAWSSENFEHAVTGLRLDEIHSELDCAECHKERKYEEDPVCADCHDDGRTPESAPPGEKTRHGA